MLMSLQSSIVSWIDEVHPNRTPESTLLKLFEEIGELVNDPSDVMEYADVMIIMLDLAHQNGISARDLLLAIEAKHDINVHRTWKKAANGTMRGSKSA